MKQDAKNRKKRPAPKRRATPRTRIRVVIAGHVDHGKSSVLGRLLADSGAASPEKIESIRRYCEQHSRPFEYAFLLDALSAERAQGVTIDAARVLLRLEEKEILFIDAPGHSDFLRNMVTGAAAADYACLTVDAARGLEENSRAHAGLLALLGVRKVILVVNKMDLVEFREDVFRAIEREWKTAADALGLETIGAVPLSAATGDNVVSRSKKMKWNKSGTFSEIVESLAPREQESGGELRLTVQDVYKFTKRGDDRRIIAAKVLSGTLRRGDEIRFFPSGKCAKVKTIEQFSGPKPKSANAGEFVGFTLDKPIFITRGELGAGSTRAAPAVTSELDAEVFWLDDEPLENGSEVTLLLGSSRSTAAVISISGTARFPGGAVGAEGTLRNGASGLVRFRLRSPAAFDPVSSGLVTARFAVVRNFRIGGGALVVRPIADAQSWVRQKVRMREEKWTHSLVTPEARAARFGQKPALVLISGEADSDRKEIARRLEAELFANGRHSYFLSFGNLLYGVDADLKRESVDQREHFRRLGEVANILLHAGTILIVSAAEITAAELETVKTTLDYEQVFLVWLGKPERDGASLVLGRTRPEKAVGEIQNLLERKGVLLSSGVR